MGWALELAYCWVTVAEATSPRTSSLASVCSSGTDSYFPETGERNINDPSPTLGGPLSGCCAKNEVVKIASARTIRLHVFPAANVMVSSEMQHSEECNRRARGLVLRIQSFGTKDSVLWRTQRGSGATKGESPGCSDELATANHFHDDIWSNRTAGPQK